MLTSLNIWGLGFQKEIQGSVVAIRQIRQFNWTIAKLKMLIDSSLEGDNGGCSPQKVFKKTKQIDEGHLYQYINLSTFKFINSVLGLLSKK